MSREIKFMAWDKERKEMFQVLDLHLSDLNGRKPGADINNGYISTSVRFNEIVLMQYTGLNDKNGNEIYEDEIIEFDDTEIGGYAGIGRVFYCTDLCMVSAPGYYVELPNGSVLQNFPSNNEVVGNFLEDPEMMELV